MELGVAIIIYSNKAELSEREYMALNKSANTSNARSIPSTCRPPSTSIILKKRYNGRLIFFFIFFYIFITRMHPQRGDMASHLHAGVDSFRYMV